MRAHLLDRVADLGQPPARDDRADHAAVAVERDADREVVAAHVEHRLLVVEGPHGGEERLRGGGPLSESARKPGGDSSSLAGVSARSVTARGPPVWSDSSNASEPSAISRSTCSRLRERVLEARARGEHGGAQAVGALVAQALLQRAEHDRRRGGQRHRAGQHEGQQQPPAQATEAQAQARSHASRNR